jgi:steroid Delta-isomerase
MSLDLAERVSAYARAYETLSPASLSALAEHFSARVRFKDPFNDVIGAAAVRAIFMDMFARLSEPRFKVHHWALEGATAYLRWSFSFRLGPGARAWTIDGVSEVAFDESGRIAYHIDHWDAASQLYVRFPLLGPVIRAVRKRLAAVSSRS